MVTRSGRFEEDPAGPNEACSFRAIASSSREAATGCRAHTSVNAPRLMRTNSLSRKHVAVLGYRPFANKGASPMVSPRPRSSEPPRARRAPRKEDAEPSSPNASLAERVAPSRVSSASSSRVSRFSFPSRSSRTRPEMSTNMDVACSPATYADSPARSHTRFRPRLMNCRSSRDSEHVDASSTATYASGACARRDASSAAPIARTRIAGGERSASAFALRESEDAELDAEPLDDASSVAS